MTSITDAAAVAHVVGRRMAEVARTRGLGGLARHCARNLLCLPERVQVILREITYDRHAGVRTSRLVAATDLGIEPGKLSGVAVNAHGNAYMPTPARALTAILRKLNIQYPDFTFVDLGSGMGRAVLMAAELPFSKVVGVEFSRELHEIALDNLARTGARAAPIDLIWQDARDYQFPPGNCVVYMFNPFRAPVMRVVLENLRNAFEARDADLYLIYFNPVLGGILDESSFLARYRATRQYSVYRLANRRNS